MKILITLLMALFISSNASADVKVLFKHSENDNLPYAMRTLCIDGYKWVHTARVLDINLWKDARDLVAPAMSITMNQFMIEKDGRAVPAKC